MSGGAKNKKPRKICEVSMYANEGKPIRSTQFSYLVKATWTTDLAGMITLS